MISLYGLGPERPKSDDPEVDTPPGAEPVVPEGVEGVAGRCANRDPAIAQTNAATAKLFLKVLFICIILDFFEEGEVKQVGACGFIYKEQLRNYYLGHKKLVAFRIGRYL